MSKKYFRILTKEEFKQKNLWDSEHNVPIGWNQRGEMDYLLGKDISNEIDCEKNLPVNVDSWRIRNTDYLEYDGFSDFLIVSDESLNESSDEKPLKFNIKRLSEEIDKLFQIKFDKSSKEHIKLAQSINSSLSSTFLEYQQKVDGIFPDIKESLIAEIQRGHTTIVIPSGQEVPILEMDHPKMKDVIVSIETQNKAMLVGPAGTGKTYMVAEIAERLNLPFYKYSCSRDSSVHDLIGYKQPASEIYLETVFLKAYEFGGIFLVDEYDAMSGDMSLFFNGIADGSEFISVPHRDTNPIAKRHKNFKLIMCGNTWGKGSIDYSGRDFQDMALMDRFRFCRHMIGYHTTLEESWSGKNFNFILELRNSLEKLGSYLSTRNVEDVIKLIKLKIDKNAIIEMIAQDLTKSDFSKLENDLSNFILYYE